MRLVIQRVRRASVAADEREVAAIGPGLLVLMGFAANEESTAHRFGRVVQRLIHLRLFDDVKARLNRSLQEVHGELLLIPQITLTASLTKGTRPSFHTCAPPEAARALFEAFVHVAKTIYPRTSTGEFQTHMVVSLENDGPVTIVLDC